MCHFDYFNNQGNTSLLKYLLDLIDVMTCIVLCQEDYKLPTQTWLIDFKVGEPDCYHRQGPVDDHLMIWNSNQQK